MALPTSDKSSALFTNSFWPLDDVEFYMGKDHLEKKEDGSGQSDASGAITGDTKIHNWHFGMVFEFDFTVDDYKGPMNFISVVMMISGCLLMDKKQLILEDPFSSRQSN